MTLLSLEIIVCEGGKVSDRDAPVAGSKGLQAPDLCGRTGGFQLRVVESRAARATGKKLVL